MRLGQEVQPKYPLAVLHVCNLTIATHPHQVMSSLQGRYVGSRKEGDGVYVFVNGDVYEVSQHGTWVCLLVHHRVKASYIYDSLM
jgi:hypothetical protein